MAKWVELQGTTVFNVAVPGTDLYKTLKEEAGFTIKVEDNDVPVAPGWEYDAELDAYYDPNA